MDAEPKDRRLPVMISESELRELDDWRARQPGVPSRGEAVRRMMRLAIEVTRETAEQ